MSHWQPGEQAVIATLQEVASYPSLFSFVVAVSQRLTRGGKKTHVTARESGGLVAESSSCCPPPVEQRRMM